MSSIKNDKSDLSVTNFIIPLIAGYIKFSSLLLYVYSRLNSGVQNTFPIHTNINYYAICTVLEIPCSTKLGVK